MKNISFNNNNFFSIKKHFFFLIALSLLILTLAPATASAYLCWNTGTPQGMPLEVGGRNGYPGESTGETRECSPLGYQQIGDDIGNSPAFNTMFTCVETPTYCGVGLPPPTPVNATADSCGIIRVSWGSVSGATSYELRTNNGPAINVGNTLSVTQSSLVAGQTYNFEVRVAGPQTSIWTSVVSAVAPPACPSVQLWFN